MIPKKIHYCWLSGDKYPRLIENCIASWRRHLPDYEFVLWDRDKFKIESVPWVYEAYLAKKYAFAADYIRLYALLTEGGIYLDSDVEVLKSFNMLLHEKSFIGYESTGDLEPAVIGAERNLDWLKACLSYYDDRHFENQDGSLNMRPLPIVMGEIFQCRNIIKIGETPGSIITSKQITFYPSDYFSPKNNHTKEIKKSEHTYAIHHFDGHWVDKGWLFKIKSSMHHGINKVFGESFHRAVVKMVRLLFKWQR